MEEDKPNQKENRGIRKQLTRLEVKDKRGE